MLLRIKILLLCIVIAIHAQAQKKPLLSLPAIFSNHMVIQREKPVVVWGETLPETFVTIKLDKEKKTVKSDKSGNWKIQLNPLKVGGPYKMDVSTRDTIIYYTNILSGDVWLCSGQSNMEFQLQFEENAAEELKQSTNRQIRLIRFPHVVKSTDKEDIKVSRWLTCYEGSAKRFSAVGYYFAKKLTQEIDVPIGLIQSAWGGSSIETWMSKESLQQFPEYSTRVNDIYNGKVSFDQIAEEIKAEGERFKKVREAGGNPDISPYRPRAMQHVPSVVYNGMIAPLTNFPIKGIIWYQGENNVSRAHQYESLFPELIKDWRNKWNQQDLPFYFVQLPNYGVVRNIPYPSTWAELRDAQIKALNLPNTGMAVTIDIGDCKDIHPKNKKDVGNRLALIALNQIYKKDVNYLGPKVKSYKTQENKIIIEFEEVGEGLIFKGGDVIQEFTIAGADKKFKNAEAKLIGKNIIEVSATEISRPVAVRYAWANCPNAKLYNSYNLPLAPFRTDNWPGMTYGVK